MLFLLDTTLTLLFSSDPEAPISLERARSRPDVDLGALDWRPSWYLGNPQHLLRLALTYGAPCSRGIVMDGRMVSALDRSEHARRDYHRQPRRPGRSPAHQQAVDTWLGTSPQTIRNREMVANRVASQHAQDVDRADAVLTKLLAGNPTRALLRHWATLGGREPT